MTKDAKLIHKWFPFLHQWSLSDESKMIKQIRQKQREIKKAERMSKGLPKPIIPKPEPYPFG